MGVMGVGDMPGISGEPVGKVRKKLALVAVFLFLLPRHFQHLGGWLKQ